MRKIFLFVFILLSINVYSKNIFIDMNNDKIVEKVECLATNIIINKDFSFIIKDKYRIIVSIDLSKLKKIEKNFYLNYNNARTSQVQIIDLNNDGKKEIICSVYYMNPDNHGYLGKASLHIFTYDYEKKDIVKVWEKYYDSKFVTYRVGRYLKNNDKSVFISQKNEKEKDTFILTYIKDRIHVKALDLEFDNLCIDMEGYLAVDINKDGLIDITRGGFNPYSQTFNYYQGMEMYLNNGDYTFTQLEYNEKILYKELTNNEIIFYSPQTKRFSINSNKKKIKFSKNSIEKYDLNKFEKMKKDHKMKIIKKNGNIRYKLFSVLNLLTDEVKELIFENNQMKLIDWKY